jgi:ABC-type phosphate transport system ATPase subunit
MIAVEASLARATGELQLARGDLARLGSEAQELRVQVAMLKHKPDALAYATLADKVAKMEAHQVLLLQLQEACVWRHDFVIFKFS